MDPSIKAGTVGFLLAISVAASAARAADVDLGRYSDFTPYQERWLKEEPAQASPDWLISYGGRLYDKWFALLGQWVPKSTHPSYPETGKQKGPDTWRCKECHGWDYLGKDGVYGKPGASHFTGIKGIQGYRGKDPRAVVKILRDATHQYDQRIIPKFAAERLALFVTQGQFDVTRFINGKKVKGDPAKGINAFQNQCAVCHGYDGKSINFGSPTKPQFLGAVAVNNPWEAFHKARNGHPGAIMPSLRWAPLESIADILSYAQTLPVE
ncbi:MAG: hypothetical protein COW30_08350 [Rhodospirillales bacterium CG15_BIG_FIL_POST_REV_8_21_14_020_66_15]|nr:MAG: hypothetical protein COW30_08350 [Rhodospirillales bacterium CG15_BIG_FIL_POST_REV_8_21_14_020_66_15]